jgi:GDP-mannose 6-dehydrogenase
VIGTLKSTLPPRQLPQLFSALGLEYEMVDALSAEMLKFACNAFHALKVCFGNEVGRLISTMGGDASEVMRLFVKDTALNISPNYLRPGNPYGGSCLPKDTRAFGALAQANRVELGIVDHCESSNRAHLLYLVNRIVALKPKTVAVLGLAFKRDTDDVRESASLELVRQLAGSQIKVRVHDFLVQPEKVVGVNRTALNDLLKVPGVEFQLELGDTIKTADVIVVMHNDRRYQSLDFPSGSKVMDVARWQNI